MVMAGWVWDGASVSSSQQWRCWRVGGLGGWGAQPGGPVGHPEAGWERQRPGHRSDLSSWEPVYDEVLDPGLHRGQTAWGRGTLLGLGRWEVATQGLGA